MAKYTTLTELAEAFKSGELDHSFSVQIDKGGAALSLDQFGEEDTEEERYEHCQQLFKREYEDCLDELFTLAGIPHHFA